MASIENEAMKRLRSLSECCICLTTYTDPRMLPCFHTACLKCFEDIQLKTEKKPGDVLPCPLCRNEFSIPADGMKGLQMNFFIKGLMDVTSTFNIENKSTPCELCSADEEVKDVTKATLRCLNCCENYCPRCSKMHKKCKATKDHSIVELNIDFNEEEIRYMFPIRKCARHSDKVLDYYCSDCKTVVCVSCFVEDHQTHKCKDVTTVDKEFRQRIEQSFTEMYNHKEDILFKKSDLERKKIEFLAKVVETESAIRNKNQQLKALIDQHTEELLNELSLLKQHQEKKIDAKVEELERKLTIQESFVTYCTELKSKGSPSEVCGSVDSLIARANELMKESDEYLRAPSKAFEFEFIATEHNVLQNAENNIGKLSASWSIRTNTESKREDEDATKEKQTDESNGVIAESSGEKNSRTKDADTVESACGDEASNEEGGLGSYLSSPTFVQSIRTKASRQENHLIVGIAVLYSRLFIVHEECSNMVCYDTDTLSFIEELEVEKMTDPVDIASSETSGCLYVVSKSDDLLDKYYIFKTTPSGFVDHKWCLGNNFGTLSVSPSGNVVVAFEERDVLKVYSTDGRLVSELVISLSSDGTGFYHAVEVAQGTLLICSYEGDKKCGICLVDMSSKSVLQKYTDDGNTASDVRSPVYLAADLSGNVFVIDKFSRRVLLFSADMTTMKEILTHRNHIRYAHKMEFDSKTGRLFLIDEFYNRRTDHYSDSCILVFHVIR